MTTWWNAAAVYRDRRVLSMVFIGFSSGLPFGVLAEPLSAWLTDAGVTKTSIGLFALVSLPYSLKFIWAPIMDAVACPGLSKILGRRRGWAIAAQIGLLISIFLMGTTNPVTNLWWTALFAVCVAFASASQDIIIDAYRVEILNDDQLAAGAATVTLGWRLGQVGSAAGGLIIADLWSWPVVFAVMAALVIIGSIAILINPEPEFEKPRLSTTKNSSKLEWFGGIFIAPFRDLLSRPGWVGVLLFVLLYKYGDAVLSLMKIPFFKEIGFTNSEIAEVAKIFGFNAIILGGFLGGLLLARLGLLKGLMTCGLLMAGSNLVFIAQAQVGAEIWMLMITIAVENVTTGMGTAAFIAYLSSLCHQSFTATQYALLTSVMAFSRTVMTSGAGWLADQVDWSMFFILTTVAALPGLLVLAWLMKVDKKRL